MKETVVLDSTPVGILTNPNHTPNPIAIRQWLSDLLTAGRRVILPEISDYEIRREFVRDAMTLSLSMLNSLPGRIEYLPLSTPSMRLAADLWAQARNAGQPTAPDPALDGDVILAAQAISLGVPVVVATANVGHLSRFVPAALWQTIAP